MAITVAQVRQLPGIQEVTGDLSAGTLVTTFDPSQVDPEAIAEKISAAGFRADGTFEP